MTIMLNLRGTLKKLNLCFFHSKVYIKGRQVHALLSICFKYCFFVPSVINIAHIVAENNNLYTKQIKCG